MPDTAFDVTVASATRVIRSTAARSSSSVIRVNSPSTTMSLTVRRQPACTFFNAPIVKTKEIRFSRTKPRFSFSAKVPAGQLAYRKPASPTACSLGPFSLIGSGALSIGVFAAVETSFQAGVGLYAHFAAFLRIWRTFLS